MIAIEGYENLYSATEDGNIYSHRFGRHITGDLNSVGYRRVILCKDKKRKRFFVHRLVAFAYHTKEDDNHVVNHKDSNKENNEPSNLEWCSPSHNSKHSWKEGTQKVTQNFTQEQNRKISKKDGIMLVGKYKSKTLNAKEEAIKYGVTVPAIYNTIYRKIEKDNK